MSRFDDFRDNALTWPSLTVSLRLLPWEWRLLWRWDSEPSRGDDESDPRDRVAGYVDLTAQVGPLRIDYGHNRPAFTWEVPA